MPNLKLQNTMAHCRPMTIYRPEIYTNLLAIVTGQKKNALNMIDEKVTIFFWKSLRLPDIFYFVPDRTFPSAYRTEEVVVCCRNNPK